MGTVFAGSLRSRGGDREGRGSSSHGGSAGRRFFHPLLLRLGKAETRVSREALLLWSRSSRRSSMCKGMVVPLLLQSRMLWSFREATGLSAETSPKQFLFENPRHVYCQPVHNTCQLILPYLYPVNIDIFFPCNEFILNSPFHSLSFSTHCSSSSHATVRNPSSGRTDSRDIQSTNQMATKRARSCRCSGE